MLRGKVVLLTGAAGGIGSAAARLLAEDGAQLWLGDIDEERVQALAEELRDGDVRPLRLDVTDSASVAGGIERIRATSGRLDVLYNGAGGTQPGETVITDADDAVFWSTIGVDLFGTWLCCKHAAGLMRGSGGGAIVNTSSIVASIGFPRHPAYSAAKGGVAALTRSLAVALAPDDIRVNAVAPGITRSPRVERSLQGGRIPQAVRERHLLGFLDCDEVARKILFLASSQSAGMTGQILIVDSGATIT